MVFAHAYLAFIPPHLWQWTGLKKLTESPSFKPGGKCVRKIYSSHLLNTLTNISAALKEEELIMQEEQRNGCGGSSDPFRSRIFNFIKSKLKGFKGVSLIKVGEIGTSCIIPCSTTSSFYAGGSITGIFEQLGRGEATPEEQQIRNIEHSGTRKKQKNVKYCAEKKFNDLEQVSTLVFVASHELMAKYSPDVEGAAAGLMRVWKQSKFLSWHHQ